MSNSDLEDEIHQTMASIKISKTDAEKIALESDEMIDKIVDGIYISDAASVISDHGHEKIQELDISHILTTSGMPIPESSRLSNVHYKFIFMMDMLSQDLLGNNVLEDAITYIEKVRKSGGRILVHCEVGISRSVAVVAAYLMKIHEWTPSKAILCIQKVRPIACPNTSFIRQLAIFHQLGYKADSESLSKSSHYRHFCADTGNIPHLDEATPSENREDSERKLVIGPNTKAAMLSASTHRRYRCRKCRTDLFYDTHLMRHSLGGSMEDDDEDYGNGLKDTEICEFDYLIMPMKWMKCDEYQGKLNCPKCNDKLGQYIWGGRQCQGEDGKFCGRHVTPWFHIQKVKVDESVMSQLAARLAHLPTIIHPPKSSLINNTENVAETC